MYGNFPYKYNNEALLRTQRADRMVSPLLIYFSEKCWTLLSSKRVFLIPTLKTLEGVALKLDFHLPVWEALTIPISSPRNSASPRRRPIALYPGLVFLWRSSSIWWP